MAKNLILIGAILIIVGLLWPWLSKFPVGRLPGDIVVRRGGFSFYFPLATSIVISVVVSLILSIFRK
ncbi:MAG: hypothetical protein BM485_01005 [Desulfobulbaceae bacterium DB1]|nr:MAG: hypothetical protein BM485_01005 [Desulfobulbaceae bacterium DB1]